MSLHQSLHRLCLRSCAPVLFAALWFVASGLPAAAKAKIIRISIPGSALTVAYGINDAGSVTGAYGGGSGPMRGFIPAADGTITTFDPPGSAVTYGMCINNLGAIGGYWTDYTGHPIHGYLRSPTGEFA